jgi:uncharacterized protein
VNVVRHTDAAVFAAVARPLLSHAEAENNLPLGICAWLETGVAGDPPYLVTVEDAGRVVGVALMTPPRKLILPAAPPESIAAVCGHLVQSKVPVPGVIARADVADAFAAMWRSHTGDDAHVELNLRIYQLTAVVPPRAVTGRFRQAGADDLTTVEPWARAFVTETGVDDDAATIAAMVRAGVQSGRLYLWDDGQPVTMAMWAGPTPNGVRVSLVYTPPAFRGRGYASACVAALSEMLLASGRRFCFLFTDLANPVSNSIYARIGYRPVCDFREYRFSSTVSARRRP